MNPIAIAVVVLVCVFGGALLGMFLRTVLPEHHLSEASQDLVKLVTGLIATLAALVLGLMIASAKNSFDTVNEGFRESAARIILLDRALAQYGPETKELRELLQTGVAARVAQLFPKDKSERSPLDAAKGTSALEDFERRLRALSPQNDAQRSLQSRALGLSDAVSQERWLGVEHEDSSIPAPFLVVLVFWLATMFAGFGLFAPRNAIAPAVMFLGALSVASAIFLIEELNNPLEGVITVSGGPLYRALGQLGR